MKKIILIFLLIVLTTGCTNNVNINFEDNGVEFDVESKFTLTEYKNVASVYNTEIDLNMSNSELESLIYREQDNFTFPAYYEEENSSNESFAMLKTKLTNNKQNYELTGEYLYSYDNFKDNYLLNYCFDYFSFTEDKESYYFKIAGDYNCSYENIKLNIVAHNRMVNNNSNDVNDNTYSWDIKKENNDIYFVVSKEKLEFKQNNIFYIIGGIIVGIMIIVTLGFYKKYNN